MKRSLIKTMSFLLAAMMAFSNVPAFAIELEEAEQECTGCEEHPEQEEQIFEEEPVSEEELVFEGEPAFEEETFVEEVELEQEPLYASVVANGYCGAEGDGTNLEWTIDSNGKLTISGKGEMKDYDYSGFNTNAPWDNYDHKFSSLVIEPGVTSIGKLAFNDYENLTGSIVIPESVTYIGESAFSGCGFSGKLVIPGTVKAIGDAAFADCTGLTELVISDGVKSIGDYAFSDCEFAGSLVTPDSITYIGNYSFWNNEGFTGNLIIPDGVKNIGEGAFSGCSGLTGEVFIPESIESIGIRAFSEIPGIDKINVDGDNQVYSSINGILYSKDKESLILCPSGKKGNVVIPKTVITIGDYAFYDCEGITGDLVIPDNVITIGESAFYRCKNLTGNLIIGNGVTTIGISAFGRCENFKGNLVIGNSVTSIGQWAFTYCGFVGDLVIPDSVTTIGPLAFSYCEGFTGDLVIGNGITEIKEGTFVSCTGFTNLVIGSKVTTIGKRAFEDCSGLTGNLIINNYIYILPDAFVGCGIDNYYFAGDAPRLYGYAAPRFDDDDTLYYRPGNDTWVIVDGKWNGYTAEEWVCYYNGTIKHDLGDWYYVKTPSTYINGERRRDCENCKYYEEEIIPAEIKVLHGDANDDGNINVIDANIIRMYAVELADLSEKEYVAADVDGNGDVNVLDANRIRKYVVKLITTFPASLDKGHTHTPGEWTVAVAPTCVEEGRKVSYCVVCGNDMTETIDSLGGHKYSGKIIVNETCATEGTKEYTCSVCGDSYTETIPANGRHNYSSEIVYEATCEYSGMMRYTCTVCDDSYTETIEALGHNYVGVSCTTNGRCSRCGEIKYATGHSYVYGRCSVCSYLNPYRVWTEDDLRDMDDYLYAALVDANKAKSYADSAYSTSYSQQISNYYELATGRVSMAEDDLWDAYYMSLQKTDLSAENYRLSTSIVNALDYCSQISSMWGDTKTDAAELRVEIAKLQMQISQARVVITEEIARRFG